MTTTVARFAIRAGCTAIAVPLSIGASGCGSSPQGADGANSERVASSQEAFTEVNCNFTAPDFSCGNVDSSKGCAGPSIDGNYNHSTCTNAWIGQGTIRTIGSRNGLISVDYDGSRAPIPDGHRFPCNSTWVRGVVLQFRNGLWTQFSDSTAYGRTVQGECLVPSVPVSVPSGTYKVLAQAGFIFTYEPVETIFLDD